MGVPPGNNDDVVAGDLQKSWRRPLRKSDAIKKSKTQVYQKMEPKESS